MRITRRGLARTLAAAASLPLVVPAPAQAQEPPAPAPPEVEAAQRQLAAASDAVARVELPAESHPAFRFQVRK